MRELQTCAGLWVIRMMLLVSVPGCVLISKLDTTCGKRVVDCWGVGVVLVNPHDENIESS